MKQKQLIIGALAIAGILMTGWLAYTSDPAPVLGKSAGVAPSTSSANTTGEKKSFIDALSSWGHDTRTVINGIKVPPMPDAKLNNATIAGVDSDNSGIPDNIDRMVAEKFGNNPIRYQAVMQYERGLQAVFLDPANRNLITAHKNRMSCIAGSLLPDLALITRESIRGSARGAAYAAAFAGTGDGERCSADRVIH